MTSKQLLTYDRYSVTLQSLPEIRRFICPNLRRIYINSAAAADAIDMIIPSPLFVTDLLARQLAEQGHPSQ